MRGKHRTKAKKKDGKRSLYTLEVFLVEGPLTESFVRENPVMSRKIQILGNQTLAQLHEKIFDAFDREEEHLYEFQFGPGPHDPDNVCYGLMECNVGPFASQRMAGDVTTTTIDSLGLTDQHVFGYWFDFGDDWYHQINVLSIRAHAGGAGFPKILERQGASPPQYVDWEEMVDEADEEDDANDFVPLAENIIEEVIELTQMEFRQEIEKKPLRPNTKLQAALNKLPAIWIEGICMQVGVTGPQQVKARVKVLVEILPLPETLNAVWKKLPEPSRRLLHYLVVDEPGFCAVQKISRRFGRDDDISWFWNEGQTPVTPLGLLRLYGLVFVGTTKIRNRNTRIASVPMEFRENLSRLAARPNAFENAPPLPDEDVVSLDDPAGSRDMVVQFGDFLEPSRMGLEMFLNQVPFNFGFKQEYMDAMERFCDPGKDESPNLLRELLQRIISGGNFRERLEAYKTGLGLFGKEFIEPAKDDPANTIRLWALKILDPRQRSLF